MRLGFFIEKGRVPSREADPGDRAISVDASPLDEILLAEVRRRYDLQQEEIDTTNTKAGLTLAYLGTVFVILVTSAPSICGRIIQSGSMPLIIMAPVTLLLYIAAAICCIVTIAPRDFRSPVGVERQEINSYLSQDRDSALLQLLSQYGEYTQRNVSKIKSKNRWLMRSLILGVVFTLAGIFTICLAAC